MNKTLLWIDISCSYAHSSLALPALHAQGEGDMEWRVVRGTTSGNAGALAAQIAAANPAIVASTAWLFNTGYLREVIARVKALLPQCTVILGGPEFLGCNENFLRANPQVDCVFRGEGESEFGKWLASTPQEWHSIRGLCYIDPENRYTDNGAARAERFEDLVSPEESRFFNWDKPFVQLETTRGCFSGCKFCVSGAEKPVRSIPMQAVARRLEKIYSEGIREIRLLDRTFNGNPRQAAELLELFARFTDMRFHLEIHPALLPSGLRKALSAMPHGMLHVEAGIQSLCAPVLEACGRSGSLEDSMDGLRFLCSAGNLAVHADLIAGLPHYTLDQVYTDLRTLAGLGAHEIQLELLKLLPGTEMRRSAAETGLVYSPLPPYEILRTDSVSAQELVEARLLSRLTDMYYNSAAWQAVVRKLILGHDGFLKDFLSYLAGGDYLDQPLGIEKRGLLLYGYVCKNAPEYASDVENAWSNANLTMRKIESYRKNISL